MEVLIRSLNETQKLGAVNAALLVVRTLIESDAHDGQTKVLEAESRARYAQLLASRLKLGHVTTHRLALAAWLSALEGRDSVLHQLSAEHDLDDVLFPQGQMVEDMRTEARILGIVKCYEMLKKQYPDIITDLEQTLLYLKEILPSDPEHRRLLRIFAKILEDEVFLVGNKTVAGRILIVDPDEAVTPVLSPPLISEGYDVRVVASVDAAKSMLEEFSPHLIMAEMDLPLDTGIDFCREIKSDRNLGKTPFIILTWSQGHRTETKCLKAGADDVFARPIDLEMLFLKVQRYLAAPSDDKRVAATGVSGSLSDVSFTDIIQIITVGSKSLELTLVNGDQVGSVYILDGQIIHAELGDIEGAEAFYRMMHWQKGTFKTQQRSDFDKHSIHGSVMGLLMEGSRRVDETDSSGASITEKPVQ
ncbi:MAG: response regulator [Lentisphaerae bacterium]|nr:response regulator [Lentisphaerota bacterium]